MPYEEDKIIKECRADSIYFNMNGRNLYISNEDKTVVHKLAFSWHLGSIYKGSRLKHLLKRFFTTWNIRDYKNTEEKK